MRFMRLIRALAAALSALLLVCCLQPASLAEGEALTLLFTTDIHSNVVPYRTVTDGEVVTVGGFAELKTAIDENYVEGGTLLLDAGDFSIGTMYQNYFLGGSVELPLLDELGYDAVALGNHDFDYGEDGLMTCLSAFRQQGGTLDLLCANLIEKGGAVSGDQYTNPMASVGVSNYKIIERGGCRIGLFGLMGEDAKSYIVNEKLDFADSVKTAETYVKLLRETEKVDLVILLSHLGTMPGTAWTEDQDLAAAVDGIDVIISGHSHVALSEALHVNDTVIVGAGTALNYLGKLVIRREGGRWETVSHELLPITEAYAPDPAIAEKIAAWQAELDENYLGFYGVPETADVVVALSPCTFPTGDEMCLKLSPYPFSALLMDAYAYGLYELAGSDADFGALAVGSVRSAIYEGGVTVSEIYKVLGYGDSPVDGKSGSPVITAYVTGRELFDIAETSASLSSIVSAAQLFFTGLRYTVDEGRPLLNRVYKVELMDRTTGAYHEVARDDTLYKMACSYSAANLISLVKDNSYGLFSVSLRDESGTPVSGEALLDRIVHYELPTGEVRELKEWYALYAYIKSLPTDENGLHVIPASYETEAADYCLHTDEGVKVFFEAPSKPARIVLSAVAVLLVIAVAVLMLSLRHARKKKGKTA